MMGRRGDTSATIGNANAAMGEENEEWLELPENFKPSEMDVIVGWARQNYHHEGNQMLRDLVRENVPRYMAARTKHDKGIIIGDILETVRRDSPTGVGLVKQNPTTERWSYIGNDKAKDKIGHALRKSSKELLKMQQEQPGLQQQGQGQLHGKFSQGGRRVSLSMSSRMSWSSKSNSSLSTSLTASPQPSNCSMSITSVGAIRGTIDNNSGKNKLQLYATSSSSSNSLVPPLVPSSSARSSPPSNYPYHPNPSQQQEYHQHQYQHQYQHQHQYHHHQQQHTKYDHHQHNHKPSSQPRSSSGAFQAIHPPPHPTLAATSTTTPITAPPPAPVSLSSGLVAPVGGWSPPVIAPLVTSSSNAIGLNLKSSEISVPVREVSVPASPGTRPNSVNSNLSSRSSGSIRSSPASSSLSQQHQPHHPYSHAPPPQHYDPHGSYYSTYNNNVHGHGHSQGYAHGNQQSGGGYYQHYPPPAHQEGAAANHHHHHHQQHQQHYNRHQQGQHHGYNPVPVNNQSNGHHHRHQQNIAPHPPQDHTKNNTKDIVDDKHQPLPVPVSSMSSSSMPSSQFHSSPYHHHTPQQEQQPHHQQQQHNNNSNNNNSDDNHLVSHRIFDEVEQRREKEEKIAIATSTQQQQHNIHDHRHRHHLHHHYPNRPPPTDHPNLHPPAPHYNNSKNDPFSASDGRMMMGVGVGEDPSQQHHHHSKAI